MYKQRITQVQEIMKAQKLDALLITNFYNICYLTGFRSLSPEEREGYVLILPHTAYFFTDNRYLTDTVFTSNEKNGIETLKITHNQSIFHHLKKLLPSSGVLGFESHDVKYYEYEKLRDIVTGECIPTVQVVEEIRKAKDTVEIATIQKACHLMDECLGDVRRYICIGVTEQELYFRIEQWIKQKGYRLAFNPFIVAVDKNSALAHYNTLHGYGIIQKGSVVLVDCGIEYNGYQSDITRMFFIAPQSEEVKKTYASLLNAQTQTIAYIQREKSAKSVDAFCRNILEKDAIPVYEHSTGHGVGLEIHESPRLSPLSSDLLQDNYVFTVEPGVYIQGKWGMRIEDSVVIKNKKPKILTTYSKEFFELTG